MLRKEIIKKLNYERTLFNKVLIPMATKRTNRDRYGFHLSSNAVRSIKSEMYVFPKYWTRAGKVTYISGSKLSFVSSEKLSSGAFNKLKSKLSGLTKYLKDKLHINRVYGYELTVNPRKLTYNEVSTLNSKIIRRLRNNSEIRAIQKAVEDTYIHDSINVHLHYLIMATKPLNQTKMKRYSRRYGRQVTDSVTHVYSRVVDDWTKAESYITKQYGLPLPLKHRRLSNGKRNRLNQFQEFMKLPESKRMALIAKDIKDGKGIEKHRLYFNTAIAKRWHKYDVARHYCIKHNVLVKLDHRNCTENGRIRKNGHHRYKLFSRHHYSENERLSTFYGHDTYAWTKQPKESKQMALIFK